MAVGGRKALSLSCKAQREPLLPWPALRRNNTVNASRLTASELGADTVRAEDMLTYVRPDGH